MMPVHETRAHVIASDPMGRHYRRLRIETGWETWSPGQFVMVRAPRGAVLLRRPFGIVDITDGVLEICFKIVGAGTEALARLASGDCVDVLGPLGNGFTVIEGATHVLVAGGYGIAPLVGMARRCCARGERVAFFYGAKSLEHILYRDVLDRSGIEVNYATEDGSIGAKGLVSEVLAKKISQIVRPVLYCCGPKPLMRAVAAMAATEGVAAYVSLDEYMACGMGVCLGCMCTRTDGSQARACREGPVFDAGTLKW